MNLLALKQIIRKLLVVFILIVAPSCMTTHLKPEPIIEQVARLLNSNQRPFGFTLSSKLNSNLLGHQYLFIILPFGRIEAPQIIEHSANEIITRLALKGYSPVFIQQAENIKRSYPILHISIDELTLTAYDLIFMRKIVCRMTLSAQIISADNIIKRTEKVSGYQSRYVAFAFEPDLSNMLRITVQETVTELINKIGI